MGHIVFEETDKIDLGEGDWVEIKRRMSYGDHDDQARAQMKIQINAQRLRALQGRNTEVTEDEMASMSDIELSTGKLELLAINIKGWNLKGLDGQVLPVNRDTIRMLDDDTARLILAEIAARNTKKKVGTT